jgi:hypothetical protein
LLAVVVEVSLRALKVHLELSNRQVFFGQSGRKTESVKSGRDECIVEPECSKLNIALPWHVEMFLGKVGS